MLSYIYQLAYRFEHEHDLRPNTLYLNNRHFEHLRHEFADPDDISSITHYLGMHIVLTREVSHPRLAHLRRSWHATTSTWEPAQGGRGRSIQY
jgi:hypothetical protein